MKKTYPIDVDCANCANLMQEAAEKVRGVSKCEINFMTLKMNIDFEENVNPSDIMPKVLETCRRIDGDCDIDY